MLFSIFMLFVLARGALSLKPQSQIGVHLKRGPDAYLPQYRVRYNIKVQNFYWDIQRYGRYQAHSWGSRALPYGSLLFRFGYSTTARSTSTDVAGINDFFTIRKYGYSGKYYMNEDGTLAYKFYTDKECYWQFILNQSSTSVALRNTVASFFFIAFSYSLSKI